jgi:hypothetical protein
MDSAEIKRLAAEVSVQHGIRVDPDDPIMAIVTLNRLMLEGALADASRLIRSATEEFNRSVERVHIRAGAVVAQEVRESIAAIREEIQKDIDKARLTACELIGDLQRSQSKFRTWLWMSAGLVSGAGLLAIGILVGSLLR